MFTIVGLSVSFHTCDGSDAHAGFGSDSEVMVQYSWRDWSEVYVYGGIFNMKKMPGVWCHFHILLVDISLRNEAPHIIPGRVLLFTSTSLHSSTLLFISSNKSRPPHLSYQGLTVLGSCLASENVCFFYFEVISTRLCQSVCASKCSAPPTFLPSEPSDTRRLHNRFPARCWKFDLGKGQRALVTNNWAGTRKWLLMTLGAQSEWYETLWKKKRKDRPMAEFCGLRNEILSWHTAWKG